MSYPVPSRLRERITAKHSGEEFNKEMYECGTCNKVFKEFQKLLRHVYTHSKNQTQSCDV